MYEASLEPDERGIVCDIVHISRQELTTPTRISFLFLPKYHHFLPAEVSRAVAYESLYAG